MSLYYVDSVAKLGEPDMILLPGSKNTMGDLKWMRQNGLEAAIKKQAGSAVIFGICGGYQMLGELLMDPLGIEEGGSIRGMELLPVRTELKPEKVRRQVEGTIASVKGVLAPLAGKSIKGYEIHMGDTEVLNPESFCRLAAGNGTRADGTCEGNVYGTYVHGVFDEKGIANALANALAARKGVSLSGAEAFDYAAFKETQYDKLAATLREYLDMERIYEIMGIL